MSIAGLKFQPGTSDRFGGVPQETKSGSYIYWGDAASFHDWKFRTELRIRLHDQAQSQKDPSDEPVDPATASAEPGGEPTEEFPFLVNMCHRPSQLLHRRQLLPRSQLPLKVSQRPLLIEAS